MPCRVPACLHVLTKFALLVGTSAVISSTSLGQPMRDAHLDAEPLAKVSVQALGDASTESYAAPNQLAMYQPEAEDPLSFYARTPDGEWRIPTEVDADDPWVRLLMLGPGEPTIIDMAIELNEKPYRAAREAWIDKLLAEAKATFLVRAGEDAADAAGITDVEAETENTDAEESDTEDDAVAAEDASDDKAASEDEDAVPMVKAQSRQTRTLFKRLINYLAADPSSVGREAGREEVRWLLAEWTGGPALLTLSPAFAWKRAADAPLWNALDRDGDQTLSSEEIAQSATRLKQADIDRDDIVSLSELNRLGKEHAAHDRTKGYPLVVLIDEQTDWRALRKYLQLAYPNQTPAADLENLMSAPADIVTRIAFADEGAEMALLVVRDDADAPWQSHSSTDDVITVGREAVHLELSAAQGEIDQANEGGDMQQTQIAIGGVFDGSPLLRLLDHDNDRQLTRRETNNLAEFLKSFDRNGDGQLSVSEIPTAIRLAITHGPKAHQFLSKPINAQRPGDAQTEAEAPAWFAGMDRNGDGDLSRREFQGSPSQFGKLDSDGDGLISAAEAQNAQ